MAELGQVIVRTSFGWAFTKVWRYTSVITQVQALVPLGVFWHLTDNYSQVPDTICTVVSRDFFPDDEREAGKEGVGGIAGDFFPEGVAKGDFRGRALNKTTKICVRKSEWLSNFWEIWGIFVFQNPMKLNQILITFGVIIANKYSLNFN